MPDIYNDPMKMEFECIYSPYLLLTKKRYAAIKYETADKGTLLSKGTANVRRDKCLYVSDCLSEVMNMMIRDMKPLDEIKQYLRKVVQDLLLGEVDTKLLLMSKSLSRPYDEYPNKQEHVEALKIWLDKRPVDAPTTGDRVEYVYAKMPNAKKGNEKAVPLFYQEDNNIQIDYVHYLQNQLTKPFKDVIQFVIGDDECERLFDQRRYSHIMDSIPKYSKLESASSSTKRFKKSSVIAWDAPLRSKGKKSNIPTKDIRSFFKQKKARVE
jgi:DNA polymerase delta subunit 1